MDDCIVCDKCAKVCPVDCIDIEPIKATEEVGKASDGSPIRLYAAKFDIDMAKCCFCGLCTTVCPTECLTMTKTYDFSEFDIRDMNYHYANLSPDQAEEKRNLYEQFLKEKEALKQQSAVPNPVIPTSDSIIPTKEESTPPPAATKPKPVFAPKKPVATTNPVIPTSDSVIPTKEESIQPTAKPKPVFAPKKPAAATNPAVPTSNLVIPTQEESTPPPAATKLENENTGLGQEKSRPKPVFKPTMRPKKED
jgi:ferredoxin